MPGSDSGHGQPSAGFHSLPSSSSLSLSLSLSSSHSLSFLAIDKVVAGSAGVCLSDTFCLTIQGIHQPKEVESGGGRDERGGEGEGRGRRGGGRERESLILAPLARLGLFYPLGDLIPKL